MICKVTRSFQDSGKIYLVGGEDDFTTDQVVRFKGSLEPVTKQVQKPGMNKMISNSTNKGE